MRDLPCPKCASEGHTTMLTMETDHGSVIWICPVHGSNWHCEEMQLEAPRGNNRNYRVIRRKKR